MADNNIVFKITAQSDIDEATRQVAEMLKAAQELAKASGVLSTSTKATSSTLGEFGSESKKAASALADAVKAENMLEGATKGMRSQIRETNEALMELAQAGDTTSDKFLLLADKAASMTDTMGDVGNVVRLLASDTKNLDTAMAVGGGLVGTFNAATSAMALLGGESEELQQAFLKVQAAMAVLNGVKQVAGVLDKRSAANVVIRTALVKAHNAATIKSAAAENLGTAAKIKATIAQKALNLAMKANPVGAIIAVVVALAGAYAILSKALDHSKEKQEAANAAMERSQHIIEQNKKDAEYDSAIAEAEGKSAEEVLRIKIDAAKKNYEIAENSYQEQLEIFYKASRKERKAMQEHLDELKTQRDEALKEQTKLDNEMQILRIKQQTEANKQAHDMAVEAAKKRAEDARKAAFDEFSKNEDIRVALTEYMESLSGDITSTEKAVNKQKEALKAQAAEIARMNAEERAAELEEEEAFADAEWQIKYEEYLKEKELNEQKRAEMMQITQDVMQGFQQIAGEMFSMFSDQLSAQMDDLDEYYTTDAEEAKENANKKYITEKDLEAKKAALKLKQAKLNKAQAIFDIGLNTALAIMRIWADVPKVDFGVSTAALTAIASAVGIAQLAAAAAKPLPQYAKGRKGGAGEYALVGEKGAEIMYVPEGASIIPHNKINDPSAWGAYGVPQLSAQASPSVGDMMLATMAMRAFGGEFDYDKFGKAVAEAMPSRSNVSVSVDQSGVRVQDGRDIHTITNTKYFGIWS